MTSVNDAVILAGGNGTRMLPASMLMPKETFPLVDLPIIKHTLLEAARAGVTRIHLVLSPWKMDFFGKFLEKNSFFLPEARKDLPGNILKLEMEGVEIIPHVQPNPGGVADAISVTRSHIKGPFIVILGDMLLLESHIRPQVLTRECASPVSEMMVKEFEKTGLSNVGVYPVSDEEVRKYGVVSMENNKIIEIVEKPGEHYLGSNYVLCGRYMFTEDFFEKIEEYPQKIYGDLQSIKILESYMFEEKLRAIKLDKMRMYDSGNPISWLKSQIDHALFRSDTRENMRDWLVKRLNED